MKGYYLLELTFDTFFISYVVPEKDWSEGQCITCDIKKIVVNITDHKFLNKCVIDRKRMNYYKSYSKLININKKRIFDWLFLNGDYF